MHESELKRLLRLAKKTGDTVILSGGDESEPMVIMPLDRYEAMVDALMGGDSEFIDGHDDAYLEEELVESPFDSELPIDEREFEPEPRIEEISEKAESEPEKMEESAKKDDDDFGTDEERFYLEPVE